MRLRFWHYPLMIFTLPNALVALLLAVPYGVMAWRWSDGCLELVAKRRMIGDPAGQCLGGPVIWYRSEAAWNSPIRVHERVHVIQSAYCLGVPFWVAYGAHFLVGLIAHGGEWYPAYMDVWAERQAYRLERNYRAGLLPDAWGGK